MKKIITYLIIALAAFTFSINLTGCKKDKHKKGPAVEESAEDDASDDDSSESE
jgi:hypothetical protein